MENQFANQFVNQIDNKSEDQLNNQFDDQFEEQTENQFEDQLNNHLDDQFEEQSDHPSDHQFEDELDVRSDIQFNNQLDPVSGTRSEEEASQDFSDELMAAVEGILFTMGDSVEVSAIARALDVPQKQIWKVVDALDAKYSSPSCGIMLQRFDDAVQMSTKPDQYENLIRIAKVPKKISLSESVIETLSIIAYKQPITKAEVEAIRGVSSDYAINKLIDYDLVRELGRKDAPGRPLLFGTTEQFLRSFGVRSLSELPSLSTVKEEEFKSEAEHEIDSRLSI